MRMRILIAPAAALLLTGCVTRGAERAPVCDGQQRRPANLYGSVLAPPDPPAAASEAGAPPLQSGDRSDQDPTHLPSEPDQPPLSAAFASC